MDNKLKLNARCNWWNLVVGGWLAVAKLTGKINNYVIKQAVRSQDKVFATLREMLEEDYDEDYKNDLRDVIRMREL